MSNPTPANKPGSEDNPRVFFDTEIAGERGETFSIKKLQTKRAIVQLATASYNRDGTYVSINFLYLINNPTIY